MPTHHLTILGRVQGVGYRDALCAEATRLQVRGWVRNRADGSVEALVQGPPERLEALAAWARRGPPAARVTDVLVEAIEHAAAETGSFRRLPTL
jgi:acylphosphatase